MTQYGQCRWSRCVSICAITSIVLAEDAQTTPDSECIARSYFHLFSLRCVRLYVAWHSSGVGRSFFFQTQKSWILCFRSDRHSFAGTHANTGVVRHIPKKVQKFIRAARRTWTYRSFATIVSQLKTWHFWITGIERNVCKCCFNRYSVITQFAKLAVVPSLHSENYSTSKLLKVSLEKSQNFELWHSRRKWAIYAFAVICYVNSKTYIYG